MKQSKKTCEKKWSVNSGVRWAIVIAASTATIGIIRPHLGDPLTVGVILIVSVAALWIKR